MPLLIGAALLGCYLLLLRGVVLTRQAPRLSAGADYVLVPAADLRERRSLVAALYRRLGGRAGPVLATVLGPRWRAWVGRLVASAGQPNGYDTRGFCDFHAAYCVLGLIGGLVLLLAGLPAAALLLVVAMAAYPLVWLYGEAQRRQRRIETELPDFLDVLAITVTAGLGFRQALDRVGETLAGPLAEEVRRTLRRMDVGIRRRHAFAELRDRNPRSQTMGLFVTAIIQAEELGAPLADTLNQLAHDMRREFSQQARRRAARAAPRVSLIITMIIMPAIVTLIVVALFIGSDVSLGGL